MSARDELTDAIYHHGPSAIAITEWLIANRPLVLAALAEQGPLTDEELRAWASSPESLGLTFTEPHLTYLNSHDAVWIGARWDIARRRLGGRDLYDIYRKGNYWCHVGSFGLALLIVADNEGFPKGADS